MFRLKLRTYKGLVVTPDVAEMLRQLENKANEGKWRVKYLPHHPSWTTPSLWFLLAVKSTSSSRSREPHHRRP